MPNVDNRLYVPGELDLEITDVAGPGTVLAFSKFLFLPLGASACHSGICHAIWVGGSRQSSAGLSMCLLDPSQGFRSGWNPLWDSSSRPRGTEMRSQMLRMGHVKLEFKCRKG